jgi:hypothetical protein
MLLGKQTEQEDSCGKSFQQAFSVVCGLHPSPHCIALLQAVATVDAEITVVQQQLEELQGVRQARLRVCCTAEGCSSKHYHWVRGTG